VNAHDRRLPVAAGAMMVWIAVSPWAWGFAGSRSAVANHVFIVLTFGPLSAMIAVLRPAALATLAGGAWLLISPWVLGYALPHWAWIDEAITGVLLIALTASAAGVDVAGRLRRRRRQEPASSRSLESVS